MRKTILSLAAAAALAGGLTAVSTGSASAAPMRSDNCISPSEKANLRLGMTTKQVNAATHAHPWLHVNDEIQGSPYAIYAYDDCRANSGKVVGVAYRIANDGVQHYALARYIVI